MQAAVQQPSYESVVRPAPASEPDVWGSSLNGDSGLSMLNVPSILRNK